MRNTEIFAGMSNEALAKGAYKLEGYTIGTAGAAGGIAALASGLERGSARTVLNTIAISGVLASSVFGCIMKIAERELGHRQSSDEVCGK